MRRTTALSSAVFLFLIAACSKTDASRDVVDATGILDAPPFDAAGLHAMCDLPGSIQFTAAGVVTVPGGTGTSPDLSYLRVPSGFCVHYFGNVGNGRQLRFAPGGELFVASPTAGTTGGGSNGQAAIMVLPDDNGDGYADGNLVFAGGLPSTQGLLFAPGFFYFQDGTSIVRVPYGSGDRTPSGAREVVANITLYTSGLHWPKTLDMADDGTIYVGNGGDQSETCDPARPFHGGILKIDGSAGGAPVAKGLRNPINVRCQRGHNQCFALELAKDYSGGEGGREKLLPLRDGDDWGFPCCATKDLPYGGLTPAPNCGGIAAESGAYLIGDTPFGLDFELGKWPAPWAGSALIALHGVAGSWAGARVVAVAIDPGTGLPMAGSDTQGQDTGALSDFATGWSGTHANGRPSSVTFAADGRLFVANDQNGDIVWIAPLGM